MYVGAHADPSAVACRSANRYQYWPPDQQCGSEATVKIKWSRSI